MDNEARNTRCAPFLVLHCTLLCLPGSFVSMRSALTPFRVRSYRFQWPADLLTSWALEMEFLILGWYVLVETGSVVLLTLFGALQHGGTLIAPILGVVERPHRPAQPADRHAADLRDHRHDADGARLRRRAQSGDRAGAGRPHGPGAAVRPRAARRADRRHHAGRAADRRDGHVAHHLGLRAHRRRAHRRRPVRLARHGAGLHRDRVVLCAERVPDLASGFRAFESRDRAGGGDRHRTRVGLERPARRRRPTSGTRRA